MAETPRLSICVPSRNRQYYFQKTIEGMMRNPRTDVEFVLADNSDDPSIMNDYMVELRKDPRVVYLPSVDRTLSMIDNWERTLAASTGDWVTIIGDDDFVDPDVMIVLKKAVAANPELEAFSWGVGNYTWPHEDVAIASVFVPFNSFVVKVPRAEPLRRMFGWVDCNAVPSSGFSIYHSAISRPLLEKIKQLFGGSYFDHPVVDYDMAMKVIVTAKHFGFCQRPFSIMGSCPESNSFSVGRLDDIKKKVAIFVAELGRNVDDDAEMRGFPFTTSLGVTAAIGVAQHYFRKKYKLTYDGWEKSFVKACVKNTEMFGDESAFETVRDGYVAALKNWHRGKYLKEFNPVRKSRHFGMAIGGSNEDGTYIRSDIAGIKTPEDLYNIISAMTTPPDMIVVRADGLRFPWDEQIVRVDGTTRPVMTRQDRVA
ncbi:MAG: glycosyltransferase family 2 protein [Allorhizobium sp.]